MFLKHGSSSLQKHKSMFLKHGSSSGHTQTLLYTILIVDCRFGRMSFNRVQMKPQMPSDNIVTNNNTKENTMKNTMAKHE